MLGRHGCHIDAVSRLRRRRRCHLRVSRHRCLACGAYMMLGVWSQALSAGWALHRAPTGRQAPLHLRAEAPGHWLHLGSVGVLPMNCKATCKALARPPRNPPVSKRGMGQLHGEPCLGSGPCSQLLDLFGIGADQPNLRNSLSWFGKFGKAHNAPARFCLRCKRPPISADHLIRCPPAVPAAPAVRLSSTPAHPCLFRLTNPRCQ